MKVRIVATLAAVGYGLPGDVDVEAQLADDVSPGRSWYFR